MTKEINTEEKPDGLIFYTDGGARPNPGFIGWGFHGYTYKNEKPKKGTGNPTYFPSKLGYVQKTEKEKVAEITPLGYYDGYGCTTNRSTNNHAELLAAKTVIQKATEIKPCSFLIRTDSEYVRRGIQEWSPTWARNNWIKQDGTPVNNSADWKNVLENLEFLRSIGTKFKIEWIKGHSDHLGNNLADKLATVGVMSSTSGQNKICIDFSPAEGYWKSDVAKHPFFSLKRMYFNTLKSSHVPGEYYLGEHGKDDDMLGKRMSDGSYAVIQLEKPEPILELIRTTQSEMTGDLDSIVMIRLDEFFKADTYNYIEKYGNSSVIRANKLRLDLYTLDNEPLTREIRPPRLAMRAIEAVSTLKGILLGYRTDQLKEAVIIDVTDQFYTKETTIKKKVEIFERKLKAEINSTFTHLTIEPNVDGKPLKIVLTPGIDIPRRNNLKSMEDPDIKIKVIIYKEAMQSYRYVTVIENGRDYGIWAGVYSNIVFHK